jgi:deoxyribonuclease V
MSPLDIIWPATIDEARAVQEQHRSRIKIVPLEREPDFIAGVDAAFSEDRVFAAVCLYRYPDMVLVEQAGEVRKSSFPYVPGYLFFREGPAIISALGKLNIRPDIILIDGQGIAHPHGIGSASHLGLLLDLPAIGCAKTRLVGEYTEPAATKGSCARLDFDGRVVGAVLRPQDGVKPLFLSAGHKVGLDDAIRITMGCVGSYRVPEPIRCADMLSGKMKAENS